MYDKNGENFITYFYFEPGEDDDGNVHEIVVDKCKDWFGEYLLNIYNYHIPVLHR